MSVDLVANIARSQLGYVEGTKNRNKYGDAYGMPGVAWCAQFIWWIFREAGLGHLIPKTAYTPTFANWFKQRGAWGTVARPGALPFFDFPNDGVNRISHIGFCEAARPGGGIMIEGNTSGTAAGDQRNGGMVARKTRTVGIVGYGYPAYAPTPAPVIVAVAPKLDGSHLPTLKEGLRDNASVAHVQEFCNRHNWTPDLPLLKVDGDYGPGTRKVIAGAQRQMGVTGADADGTIVGPRTNVALWRRGYRG